MNMNRAFKEIFGRVQAGDALKNRTEQFLAEKTQGYTGVKKKKYPLYAAACACLLLLLLGGHRLYFTPVAEISIDINPSIELGVNRFSRIIFVNGWNADGQALASAMDVKYKNYTDAVEEILNSDWIAALLSKDELMTITVTGPDGQQSARMLAEMEACTAHQTNAHCYFASSEDVAAAHGMGLSCGKYRAYLELLLLDPRVTPEMVQNMTMREIWERIDSLLADSGQSTISQGNRGYGHHGGHGHHGKQG